MGLPIIELLYNIVLVFAVQQSEPAICMHISPPSWITFLLHPPPQPLPKRLANSARSSLVELIGRACSDHPAMWWVGFLSLAGEENWIKSLTCKSCQEKELWPHWCLSWAHRTWVLSSQLVNGWMNKWGKQLWSTRLYAIHPSSVKQQWWRGRPVYTMTLERWLGLCLLLVLETKSTQLF